ncbi:hypothetical protein AAG906_026526 [Vitis piasezkii]
MFAKMGMKTLHVILLIFLSLFGAFCYSLPLSTRGRWIVDSETGRQPIKDIVAKEGIARNNPQLLNLSLQDAYEAVVDAIGANGLMLVLDNHVSKPMWCCASEDGNGFFGDMFFDPKEWIEDFSLMNSYMRNELQGPHQNLPDWYTNMTEGAKQSTAPTQMCLCSFLNTTPFGLTLDNKVVYEAHWYSFDFTQQWQTQPLNRVCRQCADEFQREAAFLITGDNAAPLILSEFRVDVKGVNQDDNRYFNCLLPTVADKDLDWALWTLQGSYYYREGMAGPEEVYSVLDYNWDKPRDPKYLERLTILQQTIQGIMSSSLTEPKLECFIILRTCTPPESGFCVNVEGQDNVHGSSCRERSKWSHSGDGSPIQLVGSELCLKAVGDGVPVALSTDCKSPWATWKLVSDSMLHAPLPWMFS